MTFYCRPPTCYPQASPREPSSDKQEQYDIFISFCLCTLITGYINNNNNENFADKYWQQVFITLINITNKLINHEKNYCIHLSHYCYQLSKD